MFLSSWNILKNTPEIPTAASKRRIIFGDIRTSYTFKDLSPYYGNPVKKTFSMVAGNLDRGKRGGGRGYTIHRTQWIRYEYKAKIVTKSKECNQLREKINFSESSLPFVFS